MKFSKVFILCGLCAVLSYAGFSVHVGKKNHKEHKGWGIDQRACDGSSCCDLHIDGVSSEYELRCNEPVQEASVRVHTRNGSNSERLGEGRGRLRFTIDREDRVDLEVRGIPRFFRSRMCDNGICCDFEQNLRSREYSLHCDRSYDRVEMLVKARGHKERFSLDNHGRLPIELHEGDRCELRIAPPPPPPPPPHKEKKKKDKGVDIHIHL